MPVIARGVTALRPGARRTGWRPLCAALALVVVTLPGTAAAQVFFGSRPHEHLAIGPLAVRATITPSLGPVTVDIFFGLVVPRGQSGADIEQDLYLLWPGAVHGSRDRRDPALARFVTERGFDVVDEGTVPLHARSLYTVRGQQSDEVLPGGAPFVTFVHHVGALGLSMPATWIRIPWTPKLVNRAWLMDLRLTIDDLIKAKPSSWLERLFAGPRYRVVLSFHDVRGRAMFPVYVEHRDRALRLSDDPAQILANFADAEHLKIDELLPPSASRRRSEMLESTETVSLFLDSSEGIRPQTLTLQFGYFTGLQTWAPILLPMLFFVAGNVAGVLFRVIAERVSRLLSARVSFGRGRRGAERSAGVIVPRETLARLVPGETTWNEVLRLCGPEAEEHEELGGRRTLVYRGRRVVPRRRRSFGWFATVSHWDVEHHEVEVSFQGDRVSDVQARVRRSRLASPGRAPSG